jgi:two-component system cell cycle response regulator DivK
MTRSLRDAVVLLVEDEPDNIVVACKMLEFAGVCKCITFSSGPEALLFLRGLAGTPQAIDMALLDIHMSDVDGFQLLREIRTLPALAATRVVALTASVMPEQLAEAERAGFDGLLGKPLDIDRFPGQLERVLAGERVWEALN